MTVPEWPNEKRARTQHAPVVKWPPTIPAGARDTLLRIPEFGLLVDAILEASSNRLDPKEAVARLSEQAETISRIGELDTSTYHLGQDLALLLSRPVTPRPAARHHLHTRIVSVHMTSRRRARYV